MKTLVCLSRGLDSAVVLDMADRPCEAVMFDYGQPHAIELTYAERLAERAAVPTRLIRLDPIPLVDDGVFAARNLMFAAHAVAIAAANGFDTVALGCNRSDWERFPDCRPAFWDCVGEATRAAYGVTLWLPLLHHTKADVVAEARRRGIGETWSCYNPQHDMPCGKCLACRTLREAQAA